MNTRESLLQAVETERRRLQGRIAAIKKLPIEEFETAFPEGEFRHFIGETYEFVMPMRFDLIEKFKNYIKTNHPDWRILSERQHVWNEKDAGHFFSITTAEFSWIDVAFRTNRPGAACFIQQIGFEQKPVFEVVCSEGAKENTFEVQP